MRFTFQSSGSVGLPQTRIVLFGNHSRIPKHVLGNLYSSDIFHDFTEPLKRLIANWKSLSEARACKFYRRHRPWNFLFVLSGTISILNLAISTLIWSGIEIES